MTDRLAGLLVTFDEDIREDDAEDLIKAIRCLRRVISVQPVPGGIGQAISDQRAARELEGKIWEALRGKPDVKLTDEESAEIVRAGLQAVDELCTDGRCWQSDPRHGERPRMPGVLTPTIVRRLIEDAMMRRAAELGVHIADPEKIALGIHPLRMTIQFEGRWYPFPYGFDEMNRRLRERGV